MQGIRQAELSPHEFHEAIPAHSQHGIGSRVFYGWQGFPVVNLAGLVALYRRRQLECFMRAFMVVDGSPIIEGGLCSGQIGETAPRSTSASRERWKRSSLPLVCGWYGALWLI